MSSQKIWDFWAKRYDRLWVQKYSLYPTRREIISFLNKRLEKNKKYRNFRCWLWNWTNANRNK